MITSRKQQKSEYEAVLKQQREDRELEIWTKREKKLILEQHAAEMKRLDELYVFFFILCFFKYQF